MADTYSIKEVTKDLSFLMSLTKILTVDDNGFWYDHDAGKRFVHQHDSNDVSREIAVFQDPMPKGDILFFNPFAEGFGKKSPAVNLYYKLIRIALNLDIRTAVLYVIEAVTAVKNAEAEGKEHSLSHIVTRMSSVPVDRRTSIYDLCDSKLLGEFESLFDRTNDETIFVPYLPQHTKGTIKVDALTDPTWDEKYGKDIRKKSLLAFKAVLMGVLGITKVGELDQFTVKYDPDLKSSPKFHTIMSVYQKLYTRFNDILADAYTVDGKPSSRDEVDLGELAAVIERFPLAYSVAKHMVQPVVSVKSVTDTASADTRGLKIASGSTSSFSAPTRRFPGPEIIDSFGRRGLPSQPLVLASNNSQPVETQSRFKPHVISTEATDPFAPAVRSNNTQSFGGGLQVGNTSFGGQFGNQPQFGTNQFNSPTSFGGSGLDLGVPSTFGSPGTRRFF